MPGLFGEMTIDAHIRGQWLPGASTNRRPPDKRGRRAYGESLCGEGRATAQARQACVVVLGLEGEGVAWAFINVVMSTSRRTASGAPGR